MAPPLKVAVIGAGVSGLATARALKSEGHQVIIYEKSDQLGGMWVFDPRVESDPLSIDPNREIVHSSLYSSLRTNLPRQLMGFQDYPFPTCKIDDSENHFPGHEEVLQFLKEFAREFGLVELIRFNNEIIRVERVESRNDQWVVESITTNSNSEEIFDAVVVCVGHQAQPRLANLPGIEKWPGNQIHSHNYRVPDQFQDKIVVVIGDGPSAMGISKEISEVAKEVHLSSRSPDIQISKIDCLNNMWQHSKINYVDENGDVAFQDGVFVRADIIFHCTGFNYDFPFLKTDGIVTVEDNRVGPLYKHIFPPKLSPNLSFIGLANQTLAFLTIDLQAKWVARILSGDRVVLPLEEEMTAEIQEYYRCMETNGIPKHHTHCLRFKFDYLDWLAIQVELAGVEERVKLTLNHYIEFAFRNNKWNGYEWKPADNGL